MTITDVSAATMYDVIHDSQYRREWDPAMTESYDIARLSSNADVGYYSCEYSLFFESYHIPSLCVCVCVCVLFVSVKVTCRPDSVSPDTSMKYSYWGGKVYVQSFDLLFGILHISFYTPLCGRISLIQG